MALEVINENTARAGVWVNEGGGISIVDWAITARHGQSETKREGVFEPSWKTH